MSKNLLINGEFNVAQRGTSFDAATTPQNNDDTYLLDRWILLSDGNDVADVSQVTDSPRGSVYAQKAVVQTANKKFGFLQIIENANCQQIVSDVASLSLMAQTGAGSIRNIRAAVLSWSGTADTVTSDVVSAWNAEGTNPTLAANWSYQNTPQNLSLTTSYLKYDIENIAINSDAKNVAVFIWVDDTDAAVNDELYLGQIQLEKGSVVSDFDHRMQGLELSLAQRYYERNSYATGAFVSVGQVGSSGNIADITFRFTQEKRIVPTIAASANTDFSMFTASLTLAATGTFTQNTSTVFNGRLRFAKTGGNTLNEGDASVMWCSNGSGGYIEMNSEL